MAVGRRGRGGEASAPLIAPSKQTYILLLPYLRLARFASYCSAYFLKVVRYACPGLCACAWKIWPQPSRRASRLQQQPARLIPHPFHPNFLCLSNIRIPAIPSGTGCVFCLTSPRRYGIISLVRERFARAHEGAWCNGNTWVSKTFVEGSSPSAPANPHRPVAYPTRCGVFVFSRELRILHAAPIAQ